MTASAGLLRPPTPNPSPQGGGESFDRHMMAIALRMAKRGLGTTAPNPSVGAVIADEATGEVIARGWTQPGGRPHAEVQALRRAGERARGKTMYVTLEPCAHFGHTPPCADALIVAGLKRVVVGVGDPDPRTAGQGIARLRAAGIDVVEGGCAGEAHWVTLGHILRVTRDRPFVQVKIALDANGEIAPGTGEKPVWVTSPEARAAGHLLRAQADAIVVGAGTVIADNPALTCRLPGLDDRSPRRVVLEGRRPIPLDRAVRREPAALMVDGRNSAAAVLKRWADEGLTRVLVEGGPSVWRYFADAGTVDEVVLFHAPSRESLTPVRTAATVARYLGGLELTLHETRKIGPDTMWRFRTGHWLGSI